MACQGDIVLFPNKFDVFKYVQPKKDSCQGGWGQTNRSLNLGSVMASDAKLDL